MTHNKKQPKWLKKLHQLLKSNDEKDRDKLIEVLDKLKRKTLELNERYAQASDDAERAEIEEKLALVSRHLHKGEEHLAEYERDNTDTPRED